MDRTPAQLRRKHSWLAPALIAATACDPGSFDLHARDDAGTQTEPASSLGDAAQGGDAAGIDAAKPALPADSWWVDASVEPAAARDASLVDVMTISRDDAAARDGASAPTDARIPAESAAPICQDTLRDPKNCGTCGFDCAAASALVSCANAQCLRSCVSGYADCNDDLLHGAVGNGCETRVDQSVNNCGGCRKRCVPPDDGFTTCAEQLCTGHTMRNENLVTSRLHGNPIGGGSFSLACLEGEVVTGISGLGDSNLAYALRVQCARLRATRAAGGVTVSTILTAPTDMVGGNVEGPPPEYALSCPTNMVVSALSGSTWYYNSATVPSIKRLTIVCSAIKVLPDLKISLAAGPTFTIGSDAPMAIENFTESCAPSGVLGGISGRYGAYLDGVSTLCGTLKFRAGIADTVMIPKGAVSPTDSEE